MKISQLIFNIKFSTCGNELELEVHFMDRHLEVIILEGNYPRIYER